jgi:hypothetical protein
VRICRLAFEQFRSSGPHSVSATISTTGRSADALFKAIGGVALGAVGTLAAVVVVFFVTVEARACGRRLPHDGQRRAMAGGAVGFQVFAGQREPGFTVAVREFTGLLLGLKRSEHISECAGIDATCYSGNLATKRHWRFDPARFTWFGFGFYFNLWFGWFGIGGSWLDGRCCLVRATTGRRAGCGTGTAAAMGSLMGSLNGFVEITGRLRTRMGDGAGLVTAIDVAADEFSVWAAICPAVGPSAI